MLSKLNNKLYTTTLTLYSILGALGLLKLDYSMYSYSAFKTIDTAMIYSYIISSLPPWDSEPIGKLKLVFFYSFPFSSKNTEKNYLHRGQAW